MVKGPRESQKTSKHRCLTSSPFAHIGPWESTEEGSQGTGVVAPGVQGVPRACDSESQVANFLLILHGTRHCAGKTTYQLAFTVITNWQGSVRDPCRVVGIETLEVR